MPDLDDMRRQPLVLRLPEIDIKVRRDLPYRQAMLADIYLPPHVARPPIVIFIHGPVSMDSTSSTTTSAHVRFFAGPSSSCGSIYAELLAKTLSEQRSSGLILMFEEDVRLAPGLLFDTPRPVVEPTF